MKEKKNQTKKAEKSAAEVFDEKLKEFKEQLANVNDIEELKKIGKETEAEADKYDEKLNKKMYDLPEQIEFEGKTVTRETVCSNILYFLGHQTVKYEYVLGMHQTYQFWKQQPSEVNYKVFDSMVRILSTLSFTGDKEWKDILAINTYLGSCVEEYQKDLAEQLYYANKLNAIVERGQLLQKAPEEKK